jgi:peptide/nickel transport system substrate-binding protein
MQKVIRREILLFPPAAALAAACIPGRQTADPARPGQDTAPAAGNAVRGGTLTLAMARDANTFDPLRANDVFSASVLNNVADTLYEIDRTGNVVGRLVERTENPQPNVYVWHLRRGIKFQDGTDFNGEAVKFNLERHLNDQRSVRHQDVKDITSIELADPYTVRVTLREAYAPFPSKLTGGAGYMLSPAAVQRLGEALQRDLTDAGSGPFRFTEWRRDTSITLERNPNYWLKDAAGGALPYLDRLVYRPFPDENVRLTNVRTGDADGLIGNPPYKDIEGLKSDTSLNVTQVPGIGWSLFFLNTAREPFNNPAVRRAFSLAMDRAQIQKTVFFGHGNVIDTPVVPALSWAHLREAQYLRRDPAKARQELQSAGRQNVRFTFQISNASGELQQIGELVKDQIKDVGLDMEIQLLEFSAILQNGASGDFHATGVGWSGDVDPDTLYSLYYSTAGFNWGKFNDREVDRLLDLGRQTLDTNRRGEIYREVQKILYREQPMIVYFNAPQIATTRRNVQNFPVTYNGYWGTRDLDKTWKTER